MITLVDSHGKCYFFYIIKQWQSHPLGKSVTTKLVWVTTKSCELNSRSSLEFVLPKLIIVLSSELVLPRQITVHGVVRCPCHAWMPSKTHSILDDRDFIHVRPIYIGLLGLK